MWNSYRTGTSEEHRGPQATPDPLPAEPPPWKRTLDGIQNTVTNALYLISAQRMADKTRAEAEFNFLDNWRTKLSWYHPPGTDVLIRARVMHFKNGKLAPGFQPTWAWSGDQGLIIAGLVGAQKPGFKDRISELLKGAYLDLVDKNNLLLSYSSASENRNVPQNDTEDYDTGTGVFWCNVRYAWNTNVVTDLLRPYLLWVKQNADAVKPGEPGDGELVRKITTLTNQIAVLVAAVKMNA